MQNLFKFNIDRNSCISRGVLVATNMALAAALGGCSKSQPSIFSTDSYSILEEKIATIKGACSIDSVEKKGAIAGVYTVKAGSDALFSGWAWEKSRNSPSDYVVVRLTNVITGLPNYAYTSTRAARADVATFMQISPDSKIAFELDAKMLPTKKGLYRVELLQVWDNEVAICNLPEILLLD
jgi:hypothetical protein